MLLGYSENTACITCKHVVSKTHPILLAALDEDGWQFLCGTEGHTVAEDGRVIGMGTALKLEPSLKELEDLPVGYIATKKSKESKWHIRKSGD